MENQKEMIMMKMKSVMKIVGGMILILLLYNVNSQVAMRPGPFTVSDEIYEEEDKTLSPYFFVNSEDSETDLLPLKSTSAEVNIAGVMADVRVTQVYKNEGNNPLEAIYIFPASTRAAVYGMKMTIGERTIIAKIEESEKAREDYEQAKQDGKSASLLEQQRPNVFQMNVANIMPGDEIKVELSYTELIIPEKGLYEFVYPTVVGPRYSNQLDEGAPAGEQWVENPYTHEGEKSFYTFDLSVTVISAITIKEIRSTSHDIDINFTDQSTATIELNEEDKYSGNKDFILQYRLSGDQIESGLLLFEGEEENFFLAMIQPPEHVKTENIPPREYIFIVDVSGSMYGFPLDISKKLLKDLIGNLRPEDKFNVLLFAGGSRVLSENSLPATRNNIDRAIKLIDNEKGGGGTEILPAVQRALAMEGTEDFARSFIIVTDGYVTVEREVFDMIRRNLGNANVFSFGIGSSVNRYIIEGIAEAGMGIPFIITDPSEASAKAKDFREYVQHPVLTNIDIDFEGFQVYDVEPASIPDVLAERPVIVYGKYRGSPKGEIVLIGSTANTNYKQNLNVAKVSPSKENKALMYLWAREKIKVLDDYAAIDPTDNRNDNEVTKLGLKYNLLTRFTSFIAIDSRVRNEGGDQTTIKQPLPLPEGVSDYAVGGVAAYGSGRGINKQRNNRGLISGAFKKVFGNAGDGNSAPVYEVETIEDGTDHELEDNSIYTNVEIGPEFFRNGAKLEEFLRNNLQYPWQAQAQKTEGTVLVKFVVEKDGSVSDIKIVHGIGQGCDEEAIRLIELTDKLWNPGKQNGKDVRVEMTVPVRFYLE